MKFVLGFLASWIYFSGACCPSSQKDRSPDDVDDAENRMNFCLACDGTISTMPRINDWIYAVGLNDRQYDKTIRR
jgi:hypothetical protein